MLVRCLATCMFVGVSASASAQEPDYKFTVGHYAFRGAGAPQGTDSNLRHSSWLGNTWVGVYQERGGQAPGTQWRAGWDRFFDMGKLRVQGSVQSASGGFFGGSVYAETGQDWYAGAGLGRTNLRPYVNLNFDPNDALSLSAGRRWQTQSVGLLLVADNRNNPDQRHLHLTWRTQLEGGERLTLDLLAKRGQVAGERLQRLGLSASCDWPHWFVHAAWDPKVNFSAQDMARLSVGVRF